MTSSMLEATDPQRIAGYWLAGRLGAGGQGVVYEAYDEYGRRVALKLFNGATDRLVKEVEAARRVASFCTARLLAADPTAERPYIVSEFVEGPSLRRAVSETGPFAPDALYRLATALSTALTAIHAAGVIHRDLKPDNVLLGPDGPRVIDFGIARAQGMSLTSTASVLGTPTYLAPEVLRGERAGEACDVFAWGAVMLYAATGEDPFMAEHIGAILHRILSTEPDTSALPPRMRPLVTAALAKDPAERPSARRLLLSLLETEAAAGDPLVAGDQVAAAMRSPLEENHPMLGARAERAFLQLAPEVRERAPSVLLRLIGVAEDTGEVLRRADRTELMEDEQANAVVAGFTAAGLILEQDGMIRLAHPALPRAWARFRGWLDEERDGLPVHRELTHAARRWEGAGRRAGDLYHGSTLERAMQWAATGRRHLTLSSEERGFLNASTLATRRRLRRRRFLSGVLVVLTVLSVSAVVFADRQRRAVAAQLDLAVSRSVATRTAVLRDTDPRLAMLLSVASWRIARTAEARGALHRSLSQPLTAVYTDPYVTDDTVYGMGHHGKTVVAAGQGRARIHDVATGKTVRTVDGIGAKVYAVALSPDGRTLAVQGDKHVRLWDTASGKPVGQPFGPPGNGILWGGMRFTDSGRHLYVSGGHDVGRTGWYDVATRRLLHAPDGGKATAVSPDGRFVVSSTGDGAQVWDTTSARQVAPPPGTGWRGDHLFYFSPDSKTLMAAGDPTEQSAKTTFHQLPTGRLLGTLDRGLRHPVFSDDGKLLAGADGTGGLVVKVPEAGIVLTGDFLAERFGPGNTALYGFTSNSTWVDVLAEPELRGRRGGGVWTRDISAEAARARPGGVGGSNPYAALSQDGARAAVGVNGRAVQIWDTRSLRRIGGPIIVGSATESISGPFALSADGALLAVPTFDEIGVWETATGRRLGGFPSPESRNVSVVGMAFSQDGALVALNGNLQGDSSQDGQPPAELWDWRRGEKKELKGTSTFAADLAFHPDGRLLGLSEHGEVQLADITAGSKIDREPVGGVLPSGVLAFHPDGRRAALGDVQGTIRMWDSRLTATSGPPFLTITTRRPVRELVFAPDGRTLASLADDGSVRLWDVASGSELGQVLNRYHYGEFDQTLSGQRSLAFSGDGTRLYGITSDGALRSALVDPAGVVDAVCERAGRNLTEAEWKQHIAELPYRSVCP
ncbi:serine/threonine-protein kinase [Rhizohabitans arisaemae]|uniref:serine/threonine-protein kinase n=1 Tax=Rhizohabitans arisaemae TaxID=2720610 RepID=UPI0024B06711|nr:serine/threonine-protein kinase [Rhizohabitans arisaemae]